MLILVSAMLATGSGCSAGSTGSGPKRGAGGSGTAGSINLAGALNLSGSGGGGISLGGTGSASPVGPCESDGWRCKIVDCTGQTPTTVRATVYDPAGVNPIYGVAVYVPNEEVAPIAPGATCETCATPVSAHRSPRR